MPAHSDLWLQRWLPLMTAGSSAPRVLEAGCGAGRDTAYLMQHGIRALTAFDIDEKSVEACALAAPGATVLQHDLRNRLPFSDNSFDIVLASLCLHYFPWNATVSMTQEIHRCLAPDGLLLCRVNSTRDVNYGASGHCEIDRHFYEVEGRQKRFFNESDVRALFGTGWEYLSLEEITIDRYDLPKVVWETVLRSTKR